jgi:hypothetical protein
VLQSPFDEFLFALCCFLFSFLLSFSSAPRSLYTDTITITARLLNTLWPIHQYLLLPI